MCTILFFIDVYCSSIALSENISKRTCHKTPSRCPSTPTPVILSLSKDLPGAKDVRHRGTCFYPMLAGHAPLTSASSPTGGSPDKLRMTGFIRDTIKKTPWRERPLVPLRKKTSAQYNNCC